MPLILARHFINNCHSLGYIVLQIVKSHHDVNLSLATFASRQNSAYELSRGPVFYEAYYPDDSDQAADETAEGQNPESSAVFERSYQLAGENNPNSPAASSSVQVPSRDFVPPSKYIYSPDVYREPPRVLITPSEVYPRIGYVDRISYLPRNEHIVENADEERIRELANLAARFLLQHRDEIEGRRIDPPMFYKTSDASREGTARENEPMERAKSKEDLRRRIQRLPEVLRPETRGRQ